MTNHLSPPTSALRRVAFSAHFLVAILAAMMAFPAQASLTTATVFEVNEGGANTNAGCYVTGSTGTDNTYPTPTVTSYTDLVIDATTNTKVTSAGHPFDSTSPGRCLRISGGSGFTTGLYYIVSQAAGVATLDRAVGTTSSTGGTGKSGGAIATLAQLNTDMCSGCTAWVKADAPYVISSKVTFNYSSSGASWIRGYTSTRGDGSPATIKSIGTIGGDRLVDLNVSQNFTFANFTFDVNSDSGVTCLELLNQPTYIENIECKNFNAARQIVFNNTRGSCRSCWIHNGTSAGFVFYFVQDNSACLYCTIANVAGNGAVGFEMTGGDQCLYCAVVNLTGTSTIAYGFSNQEPFIVDHSICYGVTADCVQVITIGQPSVITNNIFVNAVNGIHNTSGTTLRDGDILNDYNFSYNMSGAAVSGLTAGAHSVTLTQSPFVNAGGLDFHLNNNVGGGAAVRAHGSPSALPGLTGTFYPDAGIAQHQDPKFFGN